MHLSLLFLVMLLVPSIAKDCEIYSKAKLNRAFNRHWANPEVKAMLNAAEKRCSDCKDKLPKSACENRLKKGNGCDKPETIDQCAETCGYCCTDCVGCSRHKRSLFEVYAGTSYKRRYKRATYVERKNQFDQAAEMINSFNEGGAPSCMEPNKFTLLTTGEQRVYLGGFRPPVGQPIPTPMPNANPMGRRRDETTQQPATEKATTEKPLPLHCQRLWQRYSAGLIRQLRRGHLIMCPELKGRSRNKRQTDSVFWDTGPAENQGVCNSCWIFTALHALAGLLMRVRNLATAPDLSEMFAAECMYQRNYTNDSYVNVCEPGYPDNVWQWATGACVREETGVNKYKRVYSYSWEKIRANVSHRQCGVDADTRYTPDACSIEPQKCTQTPTMTDKGDVLYNPTEAQIRAHLEVSPVVAFSLVGDWILAGEGVVRGEDYKCGDNPVGHALLIVGYGEADGLPYWKVKNSWGADWGESGFVLMHRKDQSDMRQGLGPCALLSYAWIPGGVTELTTSTSTTTTTTKAAETVVRPRSDCVDNHEHCQYWANTGECTTNPTFMLPECPKSCNKCPTITPQNDECSDMFRGWCQLFEIIGTCPPAESNSVWQVLCDYVCCREKNPLMLLLQVQQSGGSFRGSSVGGSGGLPPMGSSPSDKHKQQQFISSAYETITGERVQAPPPPPPPNRRPPGMGR